MHLSVLALTQSKSTIHESKRISKKGGNSWIGVIGIESLSQGV